MRTSPILDKVREIRRDWRYGRHYGYPRCCIAMYCWDRLWNLPPALTRCCSQGIDPPESTCGWVPCGIFHDGGAPLTLAERLRRMFTFWRSVLRPSSPMWGRSSWDPQALRPPYVPRADGHRWPIDVEWARAMLPGPTEAAYAELEEQAHNSELDWE